ncbi:hypothetical protein Pmani_016923 [Petrolisthes manimaculis]|uniref:Uncharacterized protein n=1 Tax=Petrolisthes manimaculis TaxID=1843537 RepID=A0AAE1PR68_9EUCA|nr:hypothetical protein Pmani_016923 [Petrolisthes manimaculis]
MEGRKKDRRVRLMEGKGRGQKEVRKEKEKEGGKRDRLMDVEGREGKGRRDRRKEKEKEGGKRQVGKICGCRRKGREG